jgi:pre-mRNA-processing factor 40
MNGVNGINGHGAAPALWSEARNAEGRVYYFNTITKATQWEKPEDLMTPAEVMPSHLTMGNPNAVLTRSSVL